MFVVFEGIDGSGKTSISNRVAKALRAAGLVVSHVREDGTLASPVAQSIRGFCRDERQLGLRPHAELLLYLAREAQLLEEVTRPALSTADIVIADRFVYSAEVLACAGRGLAADEVRPYVRAAARRVVPDLVILVDADPSIARARRRITKIVNPPVETAPSRKGQAGAGLLHRLREGYLEMAARDSERWVVLDNSDRELATVVEAAVTEVRRAYERTRIDASTDIQVSERSDDASARPDISPPVGATLGAVTRARPLRLGEALPALLHWVEKRARNEPALAAYMLAGLGGASVDERRIALASRAPEVIAWGLLGLADPSTWSLRRELVAQAPRQVAGSLALPTPQSPEARLLREALVDSVPAEVAASLRGDASAEAFAMRRGLVSVVPDAVTMSLAMLDGEEAWQMRDSWLGARGAAQAIEDSDRARVACRSVAGLDEDRAWQVRTAARRAAPTAALASLAGLGSDRAWQWREQALAVAPKVVLATMRGMDDPRAWALRETAAYCCREAVDSALGLDGPRAWRLREACADLWPGAVVKSLGGLGASRLGQALVERQLASHPGDISVLKHAAAVELATMSAGETRAA